MAVALNAYYGISLTLSDTNPHNLLALLVAVDSSLAGLIQNVGQMSLQADSSNGANSVYVGDANVSSTRKSYELLLHDQYRASKEAMNVPVGAMWLRASGATCVVNVELIP
jgi:hypothetical protein